MKITKTKLEGVMVLEPEIFKDERGWFIETYNKKKLDAAGINIDFIQDNRSFSKYKGTLRGLHCQNNPFSQAKLVSCTKGAVLDVVVDLRKDSPTYKDWFAVELNEENKKQLLIPRGFAHGFLTLMDDTEFQYKVDNDYNKQSEQSIRFDDPELGINWGDGDLRLSEKDRNAPFLKDCNLNF